jgi:hypothetical protein
MCSGVKTSSRGGVGLVCWTHASLWGGVESRSVLDQNTTWVYRLIPLMKIYSNKGFSQLSEFLRNEQVVPDVFKKNV